MSHYFKDDPSLPDDEKTIRCSLLGHDFIFKTNAGIFSYTQIDRASQLLIEQITELSGSLLDLGCGYGVIGIALTKAYGLQLTMSDVNPRALAYAKHNAERNGTAAKIILSDCFENIGESFETIALNPPIHAGKNISYRMYAESYEHLNPGGSLYVVIQKKHGAGSAANELIKIFGACDLIYKKKGYYIYRCIKIK